MPHVVPELGFIAGIDDLPAYTVKAETKGVNIFLGGGNVIPYSGYILFRQIFSWLILKKMYSSYGTTPQGHGFGFQPPPPLGH